MVLSYGFSEIPHDGMVFSWGGLHWCLVRKKWLSPEFTVVASAGGEDVGFVDSAPVTNGLGLGR